MVMKVSSSAADFSLPLNSILYGGVFSDNECEILFHGRCIRVMNSCDSRGYSVFGILEAIPVCLQQITRIDFILSITLHYRLGRENGFVSPTSVVLYVQVHDVLLQLEREEAVQI